MRTPGAGVNPTSTSIGVGTAAQRPASAPGNQPFWYATDTNALSYWNGSAWTAIVSGGGGSTLTPYQTIMAADTSVVGTGAGNFLSFATPCSVTGVVVGASQTVRLRAAISWGSSTANNTTLFALFRGSTKLAVWTPVSVGGGVWPSWTNTAAFIVNDSPAAGTYTYELKVATGNTITTDLGGSDANGRSVIAADVG